MMSLHRQRPKLRLGCVLNGETDMRRAISLLPAAAIALFGCAKPAPDTPTVDNGETAMMDNAAAAATVGGTRNATAAVAAPTAGPTSRRNTADPVGPLDIAPGYYANASESCSKATDVFFYDGRRVGVVDYDAAGHSRGLTVQPIGKVTREGGGYFIESLGIEVDKISDRQIKLVIQDDGPPMSMCLRDEISPKFRVG